MVPGVINKIQNSLIERVYIYIKRFVMCSLTGSRLSVILQKCPPGKASSWVFLLYRLHEASLLCFRNKQGNNVVKCPFSSLSKPIFLCFVQFDKREIEYFIFCYVDYNWINCSSVFVCGLLILSCEFTLNITPHHTPALFLLCSITAEKNIKYFSLSTPMRWIQVNAWFSTSVIALI